jgi:hypothetical protein
MPDNLPENKMLFANHAIKPMVAIEAITYDVVKPIYSEKDNSRI